MILATVLTLGLTGCGSNKNETLESKKNVKALTVEETEYSKGITYYGVVKAKETKKYSFLLGGKIENIYVEKGQKIKKGDILAKLDTSRLELSALASHNNTQIAKSTLDKTRESYENNIQTAKINIRSIQTSIDAAKVSLDTLKSSLEAYEELHKEGGIPDKHLEAKQAEYKMKQAEYENILSKHEIAKDTLENLKKNMNSDLNKASSSTEISKVSESQAQKNISDSTLYSKSDGYVMELPYKEGEVIASGYPVAIIKSEQLVVTIGASIDDISKINTDSVVIINGEIEGKVDSISQYPNENTRTYSVDIAFDSDKLIIGETVEVEVITGSKTGSFIPIESVFNIDGIDYVYCVSEDNVVIRQEVNLGSIKGNTVKVIGIKSGSAVITEGVKTIKENDIVKISE